MKKLIALALFATPAAADYSEHPAVKAFVEGPCTETVATIDQPIKEPDDVARLGMAWGFLLGYDYATGPHGDADTTTLQKLRIACAENPEMTAIEILEAM